MGEKAAPGAVRRSPCVDAVIEVLIERPLPARGTSETQVRELRRSPVLCPLVRSCASFALASRRPSSCPSLQCITRTFTIRLARKAWERPRCRKPSARLSPSSTSCAHSIAESHEQEHSELREERNEETRVRRLTVEPSSLAFSLAVHGCSSLLRALQNPEFKRDCEQPKALDEDKPRTRARQGGQCNSSAMFSHCKTPCQSCTSALLSDRDDRLSGSMTPTTSTARSRAGHAAAGRWRRRQCRFRRRRHCRGCEESTRAKRVRKRVR